MAGQVLPELSAAGWPDDVSDQGGAVCPDDGDGGDEYSQCAGDRVGMGVLDVQRFQAEPSCNGCRRVRCVTPADQEGNYPCTWCAACTERCLNGDCPNCGGDITPRPTRSAAHLTNHPASPHRVHQPGLHKV